MGTHPIFESDFDCLTDTWTIVQMVYEESDEEDDFIGTREKNNRDHRLLFPLDFRGDSEELYEQLMQRMREIEGTNGGVFIEKEMKESGTGASIAAALECERKAMATEYDKSTLTIKDKSVLDKEANSDILIIFHYAMFLKSSLNAAPVDYTYNRGSAERDGQALKCRIGDDTLLWGLEIGLKEMCHGAQTTIIVKPEYGYGPVGFPPRIPPNETLIFNVRVKRIENLFEDRFLRMNIHERRVFSVKFITTKAKIMSSDAKKEFERAAGKKKETKQGQEIYTASGKNRGDMSGAERAAVKFQKAIELAHKAVLRNKTESDEINELLYALHQRCCLAYMKGKPNSHRNAIQQGEKAMQIWKDGSFSDEQKYSPGIYKRLTKLRHAMAELYSLDVRNTMPSAEEMIEDFKDDNEQFRNDPQRENLIDDKERREFKKMEKKVMRRHEEYVAREKDKPNFLDDDKDESGPVVSKSKKITRLDGRKLDLKDCIDSLNKRDREEGKEDGYSVDYLKGKIDNFILDPDYHELMFSDTGTKQEDVRYILSYAASKGLLCIRRKEAEYTNLVLYKDEAAVSSLINNQSQ